MPTGYTAGIADGTVTSFEEYALLCAHAFGACVTIREEPLTSDIPEFEPSSHSAESLARSQAELDEFGQLSPEGRLAAFEADMASRRQRAHEAIAERQEQCQRYQSMLEKAKAYKPPTDDHSGLADFIVQQLESSINGDCDTSYYEDMIEPVEFEEWERDHVNQLRRSIAYHQKSNREEIQRTKERNKWVADLRESLRQPAESQ